MKNKINEITTYELNNKLINKDNVFIIDVREKNELIEGYINKSINIPLDDLEEQIQHISINEDYQIITYCSKGIRSITARQIIENKGYKNVFTMSGGFNKWKNEGFEFITDKELSLEEVSRYSRQIRLKEIGKEGQIKLLNSKVLLIGAGGLGSPIAYYLSASGIGTLGLVDDDKVDLTNLHRQIIHTTKNIGKFKVESAKEAIHKINPNTNVITFTEKLNSKNYVEIIKQFDIVIDGTDNFSSKYLINDACYFLKKPYVYASIYKFEGQISLFDFKENSPCYRCLFPSSPDPKLAPSCSEVGVLGVFPGIIGTLQAIETIKYILNIGETLKKQLLVYDALDNYFRKIKIKHNPNCELCGKNKTITEITDHNC
jgi:molybdopterin/thiamine biosynthesis adenylyltransferase/rhodanese-related sulfurtransferase